MWSDLLGFGTPFEEGQWSFHNSPTLANVERLRDLAPCLYSSGDALHEVVLVLNDGLARVYDVRSGNTDAQQFLRWLHAILVNHWQVNTIDHESSRPGVRSVLTFGERVNTWSDATRLHDLMNHSASAPQLADRICVYSPNEFQLNLAFSKAYLIESLGSKAGLSGPGLFIDDVVLDEIERAFTTNSRHSCAFASDGHSINAKLRDVSVQVRRVAEGDVALFEITQSASGVTPVSLTIEFEPDPLPIEVRGIKTKMWKVRRYQPIDEDRPFFFDFTDYKWAQQAFTC